MKNEKNKKEDTEEEIPFDFEEDIEEGLWDFIEEESEDDE